MYTESAVEAREKVVGTEGMAGIESCGASKHPVCYLEPGLDRLCMWIFFKDRRMQFELPNGNARVNTQNYVRCD
jgi:hypothetical protein